MIKMNHIKCFFAFAALATSVLMFTPNAAMAANRSSPNDIYVPMNRSTLVSLSAPAVEVSVANPDIADVHVHDATHLTVVAKGLGSTVIRVLAKDRSVARELNVVVGHDLPAIRKALKNFIPEEAIGVEMVNNSVALTGRVHSVANIDKAIKITSDFIQATTKQSSTATSSSIANTDDAVGQASSGSSAEAPTPSVLNFLQVVTGQQVMLRVRIGEIQRSALKELGVDIQGAEGSKLLFATGSGIAGIATPSSSQSAIRYGSYLLAGGNSPDNIQGLARVGAGDYSALLKMLEKDGLFRLLAEPNLVAISGEEAEFLSGGELPVPSVSGSGSTTSVSVTYKPFGVAVKFKPIVLSENRIHMTVQPEVSEVSNANAIVVSGFTIPSIDTRRAKTTVELAPGESFMIAGLISDQTRSTINQLPGMKELPILGALFRSTQFQRNETELVIAVTPYIVDPAKDSDIKLPSDDFHAPSQMEMFFYGALGGKSGDAKSNNSSVTKGLEGPTGFMVD
jgi:pilus assembly protein CpaC